MGDIIYRYRVMFTFHVTYVYRPLIRLCSYSKSRLVLAALADPGGLVTGG